MTPEVENYKRHVYQNYLSDILKFYIKNKFTEYNYAWTFHEIKSDVFVRGFSSSFDIRAIYAFRDNLYNGALDFISDINNKNIRLPAVVIEDGMVANGNHDTRRMLEFFAFMPKSTTTNYIDIIEDLLLNVLSGLTLSEFTILEGDDDSATFSVKHKFFDTDKPVIAKMYLERDAYKSNHCLKISFDLSLISQIYIEKLENDVIEQEE
jgi:hypothetical protein